MSRSSKAQYSERVNQAFQLLNQGHPPPEVVARLAAQLGTSPRQAARYVQGAQQQAEPQPIPEAKEVFLVKLPRTLVARVRRAAGGKKGTLSQWVTLALETYLGRHG